MSGGGTETPEVCEAAPGGGGGGSKKKDSLGAAGSPAHLIIKDLGEIHSRLLDHRPVIQGETRYFVKEFEEKRGLREMRVLENLKNMIHETNEHTLPTCRETMQDNLNQVLQRRTRASHCWGLSRCEAQALDAQAQRPWLTGPATPRHVGSSRTGARTCVPYIGRRTLNHCATREALEGGFFTTGPPGKSHASSY
ncbi:biogenesis of lysosome-related organelles complex 1 subunit 5 isoform X2 [Mesoplodon densirostris]|uniref:biogenesis of lysosome-related organelles complex 1 subunit 5 isoform X2 n=1 Tax=Mesoplodon densirostris TaxID=48708 RepID=UPI0028DB8249|nr:biogenesis of lysosome-related organelles complex 1 subunit 5 isoform X2 [Mesoplodon densirostris]